MADKQCEKYLALTAYAAGGRCMRKAQYDWYGHFTCWQHTPKVYRRKEFLVKDGGK